MLLLLGFFRHFRLKTWVFLIEYQTCGFLSALTIVLDCRSPKGRKRQGARLDCLVVVYLSSEVLMLLVAIPVIVRRLSID